MFDGDYKLSLIEHLAFSILNYNVLHKLQEYVVNT